MAIKILEKSKIVELADIERVKREIHILKKVRHPNIIQLYEIVESEKELFLIMEYAPNGDLYRILHKKETFQKIFDFRKKIQRLLLNRVHYH